MSADLEKLARYYEGRGNTPRAGVYRALAAEERASGGPVTVAETWLAVFDSVGQSVEAYKYQPHTSELVTQVYQTFWKERGNRIDMVFKVPRCPYTQEELADLEQHGKRAGYLPPELATQESRHLLGKMFPEMRSYSVQKDNPVTNDKDSSSWFDYETGIDAPYLNTTEPEFSRMISKDGRKLLTLNEYIIASQDSKHLTGQYLDEEATWARLGSRDGGRVVLAYFSQGGRLYVNCYLEPDFHRRSLGGRSSGVKRT